MNEVKAVIADDEAPLRQFLRARLAEVWPELVICGEAKNGKETLELIERHRPQIAFLDIRMPGLSGMEVAAKIAGACRVVFVTAYDAYAVEAFEKEAVDYLLKPVSKERLARTLMRLKNALESSAAAPSDVLHLLMARLSEMKGSARLQYLRVQQGDAVRLIPVDDVIYFKAEDKYTTVITKEGESLIRKPVKKLPEDLDPAKFWQIHRAPSSTCGPSAA